MPEGWMRRSILVLAMLAVPVALSAQSPPRAEILVVGSYHMANPGHDIHNMQADDMLSAKRQQEIAQLLEVLKQFRPTKIAIEADVGSKRVAQQYADYLAGKYTLSANETDQVGYRLAKELGHKQVYAVDVDGDFPWQRVINYAKANERTAELDSINAGWGALVKEDGEYLSTHTVLEMLQFMNTDARAARSMNLYFAADRLGEPWEYAGSDLIASWYQRNIRIYHNIAALATSPNDRVLVIYGAGHLAWLRQDAANDTTVRLRRLSEFGQTH
jgi:hypothetical protein